MKLRYTHIILLLVWAVTRVSAHDFVDLSAQEMHIDSMLPTQSFSFALPKNYRDSVYSVRLLYPEYVPLTKKEVRQYKKLTGNAEAPATPVIEYVYAKERTENYLNANFTPIVKQAGRYYYISSFKPALVSLGKNGNGNDNVNVNLNLNENVNSLDLGFEDADITTSADSYVKNSRLSSGKWGKIRVSSTGICRLTQDVIRRAGFSDMSKVHIYGYGGNLVPERLTQEWIAEHDDLPEVPTVTVNGEKYFYAYGPVSWSSNTTTSRTRNPYSDYGYYFITENDEEQKTTTEEELMKQVANSTDHHHFLYEMENFAWTELGRKLYDSKPINVGSSLSYTVTVPANSTYADIYINLSADKASAVTVNTSDTEQTYTYSFQGMTSTYELVREFSNTFYFDAEKLALCEKDAAGNYMVNLTVNCTSGGPVRLDHISAAFDGSSEVAALSSTNYPAAEYVYNITNQNHHADASADLVIIIPTSQKWYSQAKRLGELHVAEEKAYGNTFTYSIVPADELYNEFSSGTPDVSAYRRYLKMFYDRANSSNAASTDKIPQSVLLFGACRWDNRLNTLPTYSADDMLLIYETENSRVTTSSTGIDDFITILGDGQTVHDGSYSSSSMRFDVGVGRLCVMSLSEATQMVDKIETYMNRRASGKWVNNLVYVGDDDANSGNTHMRAINSNADNIIGKELGFDVHKILLDAYERVSTSTGYRYPTASEEIIKYLNEGALVVNYGGHASPAQLAHENVIVLSDIKNLSGSNYSLIYTAACETMPFDQTKESLGTAAVLNANGGAIAFLGTLRTVYASYNESLDYAFMDFLMSSDYNGTPITIGEALRLAKNNMIATGRDRTLNKHQYHIFGDPALRLAIPRYKTVVDKVNDASVSEDVIELKANQVVTVNGHVESFDGKKLEDYAGQAVLFVKDATESITTRNNDGVSQITYNDRLNTIYKGTANVSKGEFSFKFRVNSDIVDNGNDGLINVFVANSAESSTAFGECNNILFTGIEEAKNDEEGPEMTIYLNTPSFITGGTVGKTPYLHAVLHDKDGLDVMGNSIGHNVELVVDGNQSTTYNLNDYFLFDDGSYTDGSVSYVIPELSSGSHSLRLRAWDLLGNMSTKTVNFNVDGSLEPTISDVFVSPNPVKGLATFYIYHDFMGSNAEITIDIIDTTGRIMQTSVWNQALSASEGRTGLTWNSASVPNGLYLYRIRVSCDGINYSSKTKKLIVAQ